MNGLSTDLAYLRPSDPFSRTINIQATPQFAVTSCTLVSFTIPPQGFDYMFQVQLECGVLENEEGDIVTSQLFYLFDEITGQQQTVQNSFVQFVQQTPWMAVPGGTAFALNWSLTITQGSGLLAVAAGSLNRMAGLWVPMG